MGSFDFYQENNRRIDGSSSVLSLARAFNRYPDLVDQHAWSLIKPTQNKLTRQIAKNDNGYLIMIDGHQTTPIQTCFAINQDYFQQVVHNLIIVKAGVKRVINTQCQSNDCREATHLSLTEIFLEEGAQLDLTMTHCWERSTQVRPLTLVRMAAHSVFNYNYVCQQSPRSLVTNPIVQMVGHGAKFTSMTSLLATTGSIIDLGGRAIMRADNQSTQIVSKVVSRGGRVVSRGEIIAYGASKGHVECDGLMLESSGSITSIPIIKDACGRAELSHEAAIGKINPKEIEYLMTRGLSRELVIRLLVEGFMSLDT
ncbi:MAG: SufD family Fe-S cluster assembly protein [Candidatus Saccharibacteria bacterium]|nr:SufD family Fe-S cluster assembly protein [Candidatus Saccharibacteria bacterium]